jgi:hypothetical protein
MPPVPTPGIRLISAPPSGSTISVGDDLKPHPLPNFVFEVVYPHEIAASRFAVEFLTNNQLCGVGTQVGNTPEVRPNVPTRFSPNLILIFTVPMGSCQGRINTTTKMHARFGDANGTYLTKTFNATYHWVNR